MGAISVMKVYQLTPKTNCKDCGRSSCMAFAADLAKGKGKIEECPYLLEAKFTQQKKELEEYQLQQLEKLLNHAYENVPFHRKNFDDAGKASVEIKRLLKGAKS